MALVDDSACTVPWLCCGFDQRELAIFSVEC